MPEYKWTLKNKKYCTGCPMHCTGLDFNGRRRATCHGGYYRAIPTVWSISKTKTLEKKRPIACIRDLGD